MNVLALEPWYGGSHENFLDGLVEHSSHSFDTVTMAARFWKWRMQGGAVTLARKTREVLNSGFEPDVILAADMVNVPAFVALMRDRLSGIPLIFYLHENQLTYPVQEPSDRDLTYAYINYLSALAADQVVFNSKFHLDSFLEALPGLLRVFPDYTHLTSVQAIRDKSTVLHLGVDLVRHDAFRGERAQSTSLPDRGPLTVLWNHRWEYDKDPAAFFRMMNRLDDSGSEFRLILAGEHFNEQPAEFERAFERYADRILHYGYAEDFHEYSALLHRADIVVSTARHEFFGVAMMEAIYCGCHPVLPNRLSYPELIPEALHHPLLHAPCLYDDEDELFRILQRLLAGQDRPLPQETLRSIPAGLDWRAQHEHFDALFEQAVEQRGNSSYT